LQITKGSGINSIHPRGAGFDPVCPIPVVAEARCVILTIPESMEGKDDQVARFLPKARHHLGHVMLTTTQNMKSRWTSWS
jgi:hypothetical protein